MKKQKSYTALDEAIESWKIIIEAAKESETPQAVLRRKLFPVDTEDDWIDDPDILEALLIGEAIEGDSGAARTALTEFYEQVKKTGSASPALTAFAALGIQKMLSGVAPKDAFFMSEKSRGQPRKDNTVSILVHGEVNRARRDTKNLEEAFDYVAEQRGTSRRTVERDYKVGREYLKRLQAFKDQQDRQALSLGEQILSDLKPDK